MEDIMNNATGQPSGRRSGTGLLVVGMVLLEMLGFPSASVGQAIQADDPRIDQAHTRYMHADYDSALALLNELAADEFLSDDDKRATFRLMGMVYTVMQNHEDARKMVRQWVGMEPPRVEANPDDDLLMFVHIYYEVRKEVNEEKYCTPAFESPHPCQYGIERPDPGIKTLAIVDFDNNSIDERTRVEPLRQALADLMIRQLSGATDLQVVEREWLNWLMQEIDLNQTQRIDPATATRLGKLMGAHTVLLGDYMYLNKVLDVGVRMVKVETGEVLLSASAKGKLKNVAQLAGTLSERFAEAVGSKLDTEGISANTPTNSLEAMMAYADGLALYDASQYKAAAEKFAEALQHDPTYVQARQKYESLQPLVADAGQ